MNGWLVFGAAFLINVLIYGILALGLNVQYGHAGLANFGFVALFATGAFASALVTLPRPGSAGYAGSYEIGFGMPFGVGLLVAAAAGGVFALAMGAISLRLGGHYLAMVTFALAQIWSIVLGNEEWLTRGEFGISTVPQPFREAVSAADVYILLFLALAVVTTLVCFGITERVMGSPFGRALRGMREDAQAAESLGKSTGALRLKAFVLGGVLAGVAGSVWVHSIGAVHVGQFVPIVTFNVWLAVLLGGIGNNRGVLLGAFLLIFIREGTRFLGNIPYLAEVSAGNPSLLPSLRYVAIGLALVLVVRFAPRGVLPERLRTRERHPEPPASSGARHERERTA